MIHAVGPMWRGGRQAEENHLYAAVMQSMEESSLRGFQTIAIPAISAGVFGFPLKRAIEIILTTSRDYLTDQSGTCLKEVHVVDNDPQVMSSFEMSLKAMTLPSQPGPEEEHPETQVRRVRAQKNASGEFQCLLLLTYFITLFSSVLLRHWLVQEGHLACKRFISNNAYWGQPNLGGNFRHAGPLKLEKLQHESKQVSHKVFVVI